MQCEKRVALVPEDVKKVVNTGATVFVETNAGHESGYKVSEYVNAGANVVSHDVLYEESEIIVKVKQPIELDFNNGLSSNNILFSYLHYAGDEVLQHLLKKHSMTSYAFESLVMDGKHILLDPMSQIAGRLSFNFALEALANVNGTLINNTIGYNKTKVIILGLGNAGYQAAKCFSDFGCDVVGFDVNMDALSRANSLGIETLYSSVLHLDDVIPTADIIICAALGSPKEKAPVLIDSYMKRNIKSGCIVVDISIDQGGSVEEIQKTTLDNKWYVEENVVYIAVPNMPGSVPKTSSIALSNAIVPYVIEMTTRPMYKCTHFHQSLTTVDGEQYVHRVNSD